jgi:type II secretory pathway component GspD/PulD (secretin)
MKKTGRLHTGLSIWIGMVLCGASVLAVPPATAPATLPASAPATVATTSAPAVKKPSVEELLATRPAAPLHFTRTPITAVLQALGKTFALEVVNNYKFTTVIKDPVTKVEQELENIITVNFDSISARDAINSVNGTIVALGYTIVESVRGDPPSVVLTIVPTRTDAGKLISVYRGNDPEQIPEGDTLRTQIMSYNNTDPDKLRTFLTAVVGKDAKITINPGNQTVTITDTSTHILAAAKLLKVLETPAPESK